ncbi:MAG: hypothetical protein CMI63_21030 [Parvularcula sp.]|nr:hypothetical protein [Parvularcula sp.]
MPKLTPFQKDLRFVRQFARAVTSDQFLGDEIAAAALQRFDYSAVEGLPDRERQITVFRAFYDAWRSASAEGGAAFSNRSVLAARPFTAEPPRQLVLLVDVIGLEIEKAAALIGVEPSEAKRLLSEERRRIAATQVSGTALVIEDEPVIALEVAATLETIGLKVLATARTADDAIRLANKHRPDVVMADYDLGAGRTGLDAVREITSTLPVIAIFLTAYPDDVLSGDDYEPTFILTKPFDERALRAAIVHGLSLPRAGVIT